MDSEEIQLDSEDVVLMLLDANERLLGNPVFRGVTRLEKLLFLLERETDFEGVGLFFPFEAHNFGPFSKEVYAAVDFLEGIRLIDVTEETFLPASGISDEAPLEEQISDDFDEQVITEKRFKLTDDGRKVARIMRDAVKSKRDADVHQLDAIVRKYGSLPLNRLIRYVYRQYPDMTEKSVHPEAQRLRDVQSH